MWFEMIRDTAPLVRAQGGKVVLVSNETVSARFIEELIPWLDKGLADAVIAAKDIRLFQGKRRGQSILPNI